MVLQTKSEGRLSCLGEAGLLVLFRTSTDRMRSDHVRESNLLYSRFTDLNTNLIQKHSQNKHPEEC